MLQFLFARNLLSHLRKRQRPANSFSHSWQRNLKILWRGALSGLGLERITPSSRSRSITAPLPTKSQPTRITSLPPTCAYVYPFSVWTEVWTLEKHCIHYVFPVSPLSTQHSWPAACKVKLCSGHTVPWHTARSTGNWYTLKTLHIFVCDTQ